MSDQDQESSEAPAGPAEEHRCSNCGAELPSAHADCPVCGSHDPGELWQPKEISSGFSLSEVKGLVPILAVLGGAFLVALVLLVAQFYNVSSKIQSVQPGPDDEFGDLEDWAGPVVSRRQAYRPTTRPDADGESTLAQERKLAPVVAPPSTPEGERLFVEGLELEQRALHMAEDEAHANALYQQTIVKLEDAVRAGCVPALVRLGEMYMEGVAVDADPDRAFQYYMEAAELGSQLAQVRAGLIVAQGFVDPDRCPDCLPWLERARSAEMAGAYAALGLMHLEGNLLPMNGERAMVFLREAAQAGQMEALNGIGYLLMTGRGGKQDLIEAYTYFRAGAAESRPEGMEAFHRLLQNRIARDMERETPLRKVGDLIAVRKYTGLVVRGSIEAVNGKSVVIGQPSGSVTVDLVDIDVNARLQLDPAFRLLASRLRLLEYLSVVEPDRDEDEEKERLHPDLKPEVQREHGLAYLKGLYGVTDYPKACLWLRLAALQGDRSAQYHLGYMYYRGLGVDRDRGLALGWMDRARQANFAPAQELISSTWEKQPGFTSQLAAAKDLVDKEYSNQVRKLADLVGQPGYNEFFALAKQ